LRTLPILCVPRSAPAVGRLMDNIRLILVLALVFVLMLIWQAWQQDYGQPRPQSEVQSQAPTEPGVPARAATPIDATPVAPEAPVPSAEPKTTGPASAPASAPAADGTPRVRVRTDVLDLEIDTRGGTIGSARLNAYALSSDQRDQTFQLLAPNGPTLFVAQSGLFNNPEGIAPTHETLYTATETDLALADGQDTLTLDLVWRHESGVEVTKRYTFRRGSYQIAVDHILTNKRQVPWSGRDYRQLVRTEPPATAESKFMYTYTGGAAYTPDDKFRKYQFTDLANGKLDKDATDGWVAMIQHYFVAAWVPTRAQSDHFYGKQVGDQKYAIGLYGPVVTVPPGQSHIFSGTLFAGPKLQNQMAATATGLDLTVDYGWLAVIAQPMFMILSWIHKLVGNWGWTIIIFTVLIKLVFYKLSETSYRSMANMRKLTPRIQALRDRYGDDKQRLNQAMMEIYQKEKINPLGGCLPILIQIPFFIALYWVLLESVELRQAPWVLWIDDLSVKDPYFVLPLLMGATMLIQQKLSPAPPDPMQAKVMMILPIVFTFFFAFFPAGLVLYWFVNNLLSIGQQWMITRRIEAGEK
jgi:YidC/Oxa1 family membrane protein insertase